ncbi:MAG TPA: hypothetical protein PLB27_08380 [Bacteroidales bacterium]|nr:hypothetical protein [Bacteroidales bacterium]
MDQTLFKAFDRPERFETYRLGKRFTVCHYALAGINDMLPVVTVSKPSQCFNQSNLLLLPGSRVNIFAKRFNEGVICQVAQ